MNWGKSIMMVFIAFAAFIGVLVTICIKQNVSLVSTNYYDEELKYQQQIDQLTNAARLKDKPTIVVREKRIDLLFHSSFENAELKLLRPADARFDVTITIDSVKSFDLSKYPSGRYNASLRWESDGKKYLMQEPINL